MFATKNISLQQARKGFDELGEPHGPCPLFESCSQFRQEPFSRVRVYSSSKDSGSLKTQAFRVPSASSVVARPWMPDP